MPDKCPNDEQLQAFNNGLVDPELMDRIELHLGDCDACITRLEEMPQGPLVEGLRRSLANDDESDESDESAGVTEEWDSNSDPQLELSSMARSQYLNLGIDRYQIVATIGEGPFGVVYLALNQNQEPTAIKIPYVQKVSTKAHRDLFAADTIAAHSLKHENIVPVNDFGMWTKDVLFVGSPHISAPNLRQFSKNSELADERTLEDLFGQLCKAVQFAHKKNILHRHIHPKNIFIVPGPKLFVSDFAIHCDGRYQFKLLEALDDPSPFVSPEAVNNDPEFIDCRNDIFSIGKILKVFLRLSPNLEPSRLKSWEEIQHKCTRPRRRDRFQTVEELVEALASQQASR